MKLSKERAWDIAFRIADEMWTKHDASVIDTLFAKDAIYRDIAFGFTFEGREQVHGYVRDVLNTMNDFFEELIDVLPINDNVLVARWVYGGTFRNAKLGLEGKVRLPGTSVITLRGDEVVIHDDYYSAAEFLDGIGKKGYSVQRFLAEMSGK
ncbi:MAG: nuclear transport factor 2 family protein [Sulfuricaulis sp.]|nr:nuclear transport factor 2 family protein [Sulfuricaulis sp.]